MATSLRQVLAALADGEFHSGALLGSVLGVSRTAIWKHLQQATEYGIAVEGVKGRGYRMPGGVELLEREKIWQRMTANARRSLVELSVVEAVDSTSTYVRHQMDGGRSRLGVLAEMQTAGRGRLGRRWVSPFGKNLYLSVGWTFEGGVAALQGLSLAVGVALYRALASLGVAELGLKWPNDILRCNRKLGGILLEMTGDPVGCCQVVVGIGINVAMPTSAAMAIEQPWADLADVAPSRNTLAAAILSELVPVLDTYSQVTFAGYREEWERYDAYKNAEVRVLMADKMIDGIACGLAANGALRLDMGGWEHQLNGGEISLRRRD